MGIKRKYSVAIVLLGVLLFLGYLSTTVEYLLYRLLSFYLFNEFADENPYISSKCYANLGVFENLDSEAKGIMKLLLDIPEAKKEQTCVQFIKTDYSLISYVVSGFDEYASNNAEKNLYLLRFIMTHKSTVSKNTYGYSYKCKSSDADEKVCEIFDNDDSVEELYFKKVGFRWLLMRIEQRTL